MSLMALVVAGGSLGAGGANALNHYLDRTIDGNMKRTNKRPIPEGRIKSQHALVFGIVLNVVAFAILAVWVNLLSAVLTLSATIFYAGVYTYWLKRSTTQNIVIGGASGAVPPLVGWVAVTGHLDLPAWYLFTIVLFWTPPHFWALAILLKNDYAAAKVPMLPVVRGVEETARSILLHTILLVTVTILFLTTKAVGTLYIAGSIALGVAFLFMSWKLYRTPTPDMAKLLYLFSLLYLTLLFILIMIDGLL